MLCGAQSSTNANRQLNTLCGRVSTDYVSKKELPFSILINFCVFYKEICVTHLGKSYQNFSVTECLISFDSFGDLAGKMPACVGLTVGFWGN